MKKEIVKNAERNIRFINEKLEKIRCENQDVHELPIKTQADIHRYSEALSFHVGIYHLMTGGEVIEKE